MIILTTVGSQNNGAWIRCMEECTGVDLLATLALEG